jgi:hypothetical protein
MPIPDIETTDIHLGDLQLNDKADIQIKLKTQAKKPLLFWI